MGGDDLVAGSAREIARFIPDCVGLVRRLARDPRVSRRRRLLLLGLAGYLVMPLDLIPDFIPVIGLLDDALLVVIVLRAVMRGAGTDAVREHWRGSPAGLAVVLRATS